MVIGWSLGRPEITGKCAKQDEDDDSTVWATEHVKKRRGLLKAGVYDREVHRSKQRSSSRKVGVTNSDVWKL